MIHRTRFIVVGLIVLAAAFAWRAGAWHEKEHHAITVHAAALLPAELPAFFREGAADASAHCAVDSDIFKNRAVPHLNHAEFPEHFFDSEYFAGIEIPRLRFDYYKRCHELGYDPKTVGTLPWALAEWTGRLTIAFAEHRARPDDRRIKEKCLVYAGLLAHYAGDAGQPLHTTIHWDGRVESVGDESPRTGIHMKVDGLLRKVPMTADAIRADLQAEVYDDLWVAIMNELARSNAAVDTTYELADRLPDLGDPAAVADPAVRAYALERMRASVRFTASLFRTAWEHSAEVKLPDWLNRDELHAH